MAPLLSPRVLAVLVTLLAAVVPGAYVRWRDRHLERHRDDPALPELLLARQQQTAFAMLTGLLVVVFAGRTHAVWGIPLLVTALLAARHHAQRVLHGERWGLVAYLRYHLVAIVGGFGFWILLALAPTLIGAMAGPRLDLALAAATLLAALLLAWQRSFVPLWLRAHRATPLDRARLGDSLWSRLEAIVGRSRVGAPPLYRFGAPGMRLVSAVALPSPRRPAVAFSDTLLEVLDEEEVAAVFAHELAHVEQWDRRHWRRSHVAMLVVVVIACGSYPLGLTVPGGASWATTLLPVVVLVALVLRATRAQAQETASDLRAAELCGSADALARALVKLHLHARIPRRWPHDFERSASHPSLQRRLQALGAAGAAAPTRATGGGDAPTVVRSSEPGRWVVLDESRALVASTTSGERWRVAVPAAVVATLQQRLDRVDHLLGRRAPRRAPVEGLVARLVASMLLVAMTLLPVPGATSLVFLAAAVWPSLATVAASAVSGTAATAVVLSELGGERPDLTEGPSLLLLALGAVGMSILCWRWWRARRASAAPVTPERTAVLLAIVAAVALAVLGWVQSPMGGPREVLVPLAGAGAAAATLHERRRRRFGLAVAAASVVGLVATETVRHASAPPGIVWRDGTLQQMAEVSLASAGQLTLSPKARAFAVRGFEREDDVGDDDVDAPLRPRDLRFDVGRFGGAPHRMRALAARFVDDERLLVLRAAGDSMRLSVEPVDGAVADSGAAWTLRLPAMYAPQLTLDRVTGRWRVTGYSAERQLVTHTGIVGGAADGAAVPAGPLPGLPLYAAHGGAIYVASMSAVNALSGLRAVTGRMRWEMVRSRGGERRVIARLDGYPTCEGTGDGITVACTTVGAGRASIWRFTDDDEAVRPLARLPRGAYLQRVSPEGVVSALTIRGQAYVADVGARRGVRVRLPALANEIAMDVQAAGEWLAVLRSRGGSGGRLVLYRMK